MSKNLKNYAAVRTALEKLASQLRDEAKSNPRLRRGHGRALRMLALLKVAEGKYEIVYGRRTPPKKSAKRSGGVKKSASMKSESSNVTRLRVA